jgi:hypothetical protein
MVYNIPADIGGYMTANNSRKVPRGSEEVAPSVIRAKSKPIEGERSVTHHADTRVSVLTRNTDAVLPSNEDCIIFRSCTERQVKLG